MKFWICWSCCFLRLKFFSEHVWILEGSCATHLWVIRVKSKVLSTGQNKRKFVIFQVRESTTLLTFLFWIFLGLKSNVILGSKQMCFHMVRSPKEIWVIHGDVFSPFSLNACELAVSCFVPGSEVLCAYMQHLQQQHKPHVCPYGSALTLGDLPPLCALPARSLTLRASHAVGLFSSNPTDTLRNSCKCHKTETRLWMDPKLVRNMHVCSYFFINSRVVSTENQGPHYILDQCPKLMSIWNSLPDGFIII